MMDKKYNPKQVEQGKYDFWLENKLFSSGDMTKKPFTIVIPPPNVTGKLHLGHTWDNTLQDMIIRRKRMQGYDALYLPGMDHAGIATQAKNKASIVMIFPEKSILKLLGNGKKNIPILSANSGRPWVFPWTTPKNVLPWMKACQKP